jgi:LysR family transcriptional regulator, low CO2-responsive transcriptional regulator
MYGTKYLPPLQSMAESQASMDFDQLETFIEVARHLSFSRAAEKRFRTQPAISAQIRALEEEVGVRLLDRSGGKVAVTAPGKVFLRYAEEAMQSRRMVVNSLAEMAHVPRGEIVLAANEGTCLHILPEVFAEFKKQYPSVSVMVNRSEHKQVLELIIDNSIDLGIVSLPVTDKRLTTVPIHRDELVVIAAPQHPLAKLKSVTLARAGEYPLLLPKSGRTRGAIEQLFEDRQIKPTVSMELDSSELLKRFVAADVGIGFIARSNVQEDILAGVLAAIPISDAQIRRDLALVYRKDKALSRAALAFIEIAVRLKNPEPASSSRQTTTKSL